jgi:hypothetical protein
VQIASLSLLVKPWAATSGGGGSRLLTVGPRTGRHHMRWLLLRWHPRAWCCLCTIESFVPTYRLISAAWTLMYQIWTFKFVIIALSEHYYYGLYVCTCEFSFHRESFDVILVNTRHFTMGVLQVWSGVDEMTHVSGERRTGTPHYDEPRSQR